MKTICQVRRFVSFFLPSIFALTFIVVLAIPALANQPISQFTPGLLCTAQMPDFKGFAYPSQIPLCQRNISYGEKVHISQNYHIDESQWRNVEVDHLIPLCAGGANDVRNIWPEALDQAHLKDQVENQVCIGLRDGTITQQQAVNAMFQFLKQHP